MCGRYASTRSTLDLTSLFDAEDETEDRLTANYNIAPTDPMPIVRNTSRDVPRVLSIARWGLLPAWADASGAARRINARAETVTTSRAYATSFAQRRCLVPADGWYEWLRRDGGTQPYYMTRRDGDVLAFGGVWTGSVAGTTRVLTCAIITTVAVGDLALVHNRMPLVLPPAVWDRWLDDADARDLLAVPAEDLAQTIEIRPVSAAVGNVRNDGPDLIRQITARPLGESIVDGDAQTLF